MTDDHDTLFGDATELDDQERFVENLTLSDGTVILGRNPFEPVDATNVDGDDARVISSEIARLTE
ncbi:MAG: hypothetical protein ABEJ94_06430 [Halorientalis sp.]